MAETHMADKPSRGLADVTAASTAVSDIDGQAGRLFDGGYDINQLAEDFCAATVYQNLGIPTEEFTPVFSASRMAGRTAHIIEQHADDRLIRPDSEHIGEAGLNWTPLGDR